MFDFILCMERASQCIMYVAAVSVKDNVKQLNLSDQSCCTAAGKFVVY